MTSSIILLLSSAVFMFAYANKETILQLKGYVDISPGLVASIITTWIITHVAKSEITSCGRRGRTDVPESNGNRRRNQNPAAISRTDLALEQPREQMGWQRSAFLWLLLLYFFSLPYKDWRSLYRVRSVGRKGTVSVEEQRHDQNLRPDSLPCAVEFISTSVPAQ